MTSKRLVDIVFVVGTLVIFAGLLAWANRPAGTDDIAWHDTLGATESAARMSGKPIFIKFTATWCGPCKWMDRNTFPDTNVGEALAAFESVKIDGDDHPELVREYRINAYPTLLILSAPGNEIQRIEGALDPAQLVKFLTPAINAS